MIGAAENLLPGFRVVINDGTQACEWRLVNTVICIASIIP